MNPDSLFGGTQAYESQNFWLMYATQCVLFDGCEFTILHLKTVHLLHKSSQHTKTTMKGCSESLNLMLFFFKTVILNKIIE